MTSIKERMEAAVAEAMKVPMQHRRLLGADCFRSGLTDKAVAELVEVARAVVGLSKRTGIINSQYSDASYTFRQLNEALTNYETAVKELGA